MSIRGTGSCWLITTSHVYVVRPVLLKVPIVCKMQVFLHIHCTQEKVENKVFCTGGLLQDNLNVSFRLSKTIPTCHIPTVVRC